MENWWVKEMGGKLPFCNTLEDRVKTCVTNGKRGWNRARESMKWSSL